MELRIDPEFRDKIPPLTQAEFDQLKENILSAGEVYEPIVVWHGIIVDGHNRWKVVQENPTVKWRTREMDFTDKWAAFEWMYRNQLGRRNLTDEQRTVLIGKMYEARKNTHGNHAERGADGKYLCAQNGHIGEKKRSADQIADDLGIGHNTVKRAEKFAKGVDAIREVSEEAADKILRGKSKVTKTEVAAFPQMSDDEKAEVVQAVVTDTPTKKPINNRKGFTKEDRQNKAEIKAIIDDMLDPTTVPKYTLDMLVGEIKVNAEEFIKILRSILRDRSELLTDANKAIVAATIQREVLDKITKVNELLE